MDLRYYCKTMNRPAGDSICGTGLSSRGAKGAYALLLRLATSRRLIVGRLASREFPKGHYIYLDSALNGLEGRLRRHLRRDKKPHWHIDVLTNAEVVAQI